jgi:NADPH-dependent 2,4-dienoyl-CoA reductase/sulfur reductase-like enzyme
MAQPRVIVVGAGPAGVRCAQTLLKYGLRPTIVDESRRDGGQIYRRQPERFSRPYSKLYGTEARKAQDLHASFEELRTSVDYLSDTLAWNILDKTLHITSGGHSSIRPFDALVLCPGAIDRLMPVKGWERAGTYSMGAAQIALKFQACSIGTAVVFLGAGPLLYLVASQYVQAGANVVAVLDTSSLRTRILALPKLLSRFDVLGKGAALVASLRRSAVRVEHGVDPMEILGSDEDGVHAVRYRSGGGRVRELACDAVSIGYHLRPETQLADLAQCTFTFDARTRQWLPDCDDMGRTSKEGIYLAGDGVRVLGADGAEIAGQLSALAILRDYGVAVAQTEIDTLRRRRTRMDRFSQGLAEAFPWPAGQAARLSDDTVLCRCEGVRVREVRRAVCTDGASELNRVKALCRVGMGRCQGRYCSHAAAELIAHSACIPLERVGRLRGQAPIKPFSIATIEDSQ